MTISERTMDVLESVAETKKVRENLDLQLYGLDILDSIKTVELIVSLSREFGIDISPAEFDRDQWATPRMVVAYVESRLPA